MKKAFAIILQMVTVVFLVSCEQNTIIGNPRGLEVEALNGGWPANSYQAISRSWKVKCYGAGDSWDVTLKEGDQGFELNREPDGDTFTVSIGENTGTSIRQDFAVVRYSGEYRYIQLVQTSDYFYVDEGADIGGERAYTVASDGTSTYSGAVSVPGGSELVTTYVSGYDGFKSVFKDGTLSFTAVANSKFSRKEAFWSIGASGKPGHEVIVKIVQEGLILPQAAQADDSAVGGYYYPLLCGVDVCGVNLVEYKGESIIGKTWNEIFDPEGVLAAKPSKNETAPVNPCPEGWNAPTEAQIRLIVSTEEGIKSWVHDPTADRNPGDTYFYWVMRDGSHSLGDIFGGSYSCVQHIIVSCETRAASDGQYWRGLINRSSSPQLSISSQTRTKAFQDASTNGSTILRCVRNMVNE